MIWDTRSANSAAAIDGEIVALNRSSDHSAKPIGGVCKGCGASDSFACSKNLVSRC